mgnify:CR=1 FL=1
MTRVIKAEPPIFIFASTAFGRAMRRFSLAAMPLACGRDRPSSDGDPFPA